MIELYLSAGDCSSSTDAVLDDVARKTVDGIVEAAVEKVLDCGDASIVENGVHE